jgi:hypothetical protein
MPITSVTSEALQLKLRQLLPSQQGFGTDLSASDTIIPVIDLTASAEGSDVREDLQKAIAFGSQTAFNVTNTTTVLINTTGFYRIFGVAQNRANSTTTATAQFTMTDGAATKIIWGMTSTTASGTTNGNGIQFDFIAFLGVGESLSATSSSANGFLTGSTRQIADINGTLVQPVGFTPQ